MTRDQALKLKIGDRVRWNKPNYPNSSRGPLFENGIYKVTNIDYTPAQIYISTEVYTGYSYVGFDIAKINNKMRGDYE